MHRNVESSWVKFMGRSRVGWPLVLAVVGSAAALSCAPKTTDKGPVTVTEDPETPTSERKDGGHFTNDD